MTGEFDIIRDYFTRPPRRPEVVLGVGDDAALVRLPPGQDLVLTIDTLVAGRHFPLETPPADIGWKALAVNLSDLAAMGAQPLWFTLALTMPETDPAWLQGFAAGLFKLAELHEVDLIGGDTTRGPLAITIQVHGLVPEGQAIRRSGAKPGDLICVTGTLGDAALALKLKQYAPPLMATQLNRPIPRIAAGIALRGIASACIDLSDGLAGDLRHILRASGVGAEIELAHLPRSPDFVRMENDLGRRMTVEDALQCQLAGGDDYELCVCLPPQHLDAARERIEAGLTVIGRITREPGLHWLDAKGAQVKLALGGYDHFKEAGFKEPAFKSSGPTNSGAGKK